MLTLLLSIFLVVLVIYVFLQNPKSTLIPAATIPVSLVGTFFVMQLFGFTINTITLFGLTLATGLVVDDAIVVIENIARHMEMNKGKKSGIASAAEAMREIQSAVVASSLVLLAVFIPVGFFPGTTGQIYKQFALTIAASITISLFQALTLAPVLSARLLTGESESKSAFFRGSTHGFKRFRDWYARSCPRCSGFAGASPAASPPRSCSRYSCPSTTPQGFLPDEDHGYFIIAGARRPKARRSRANSRSRKRPKQIIRAQPEVAHLFDVGGFSFSGSAPNRGIMFALLHAVGRPQVSGWCQLIFLFAHPDACTPHNSFAVEQRLNYAFYSADSAGADLRVQPAGDQRRRQLRRLPVRARGSRQRRPDDAHEHCLHDDGGGGEGPAADERLHAVPHQLAADRVQYRPQQGQVDRRLAQDIFTTMEVDLGSLYVNNFTYLNRSWQVDVQADAPFRNSVASLGNLYVHSSSAPGTSVVPQHRRDAAAGRRNHARRRPTAP